jgi:hypothetical protein
MGGSVSENSLLHVGTSIHWEGFQRRFPYSTCICDTDLRIPGIQRFKCTDHADRPCSRHGPEDDSHGPVVADAGPGPLPPHQVRQSAAPNHFPPAAVRLSQGQIHHDPQCRPHVHPQHGADTSPCIPRASEHTMAAVDTGDYTSSRIPRAAEHTMAAVDTGDSTAAVDRAAAAADTDSMENSCMPEEVVADSNQVDRTPAAVADDADTDTMDKSIEVVADRCRKAAQAAAKLVDRTAAAAAAAAAEDADDSHDPVVADAGPGPLPPHQERRPAPGHFPPGAVRLGQGQIHHDPQCRHYLNQE